MIAAYDVGTTMLKGALLSEEGKFLALASQSLEMAKTNRSGHYEADPSRWKEAFRSITAELGAFAGGNAAPEIRAAVVSGNGPTLVPVAADGDPLNPVMSWLDRRGTAEAAQIQKAAGWHIDPTFYLPKALWLANNLPEVYQKTRHFLSCPEYMLYWLTGEAVTVLPGRHFTRYFWNKNLLEDLGLEPRKFPDFIKPGELAGKISPPGAEASGLPPGLPVVSAGADFIVTLLGTGAVSPGRACNRAGTSEGINLCTEIKIIDPRLMWYGHVVEPWYNISGIISTSGKALDWIKDILGDRSMAYNEFHAPAALAPPGAGALLFLPYLAGERAPIWNPNARGAFIGLNLDHTPGDMVRSVLESIGFAMRDVIEVMAEHGAHIDDLRVTGGPSKSALWNQIKADITGRNILLPESNESELLGNLILALGALGDSDGLAETANKIVRFKKVFEPQAENRGLYDDMFGLYRDAYERLKGIFDSLVRLPKGEA